ncbi:hypothetical protein KUCAC02_002098 [Chaenocephalus aceratus]|uniref:Uncharacterized protein n=1 Tax=Chaenocephalus aceratus TaxID=36190 RepID=A0ACB9XSN7_CHAAC|nr:hypothetical protein KUCAC02_002098 [Chaenocephalus aceratus]
MPRIMCQQQQTGSANNKSLLGVTVHWIDADTLKRKKAAIACRRFRGRHTYDAIATELEDIFSQYGFTNDKVTACVTDNGSNFVKAFKEHQQRQFESDEEEHEVDVDCEADFTDLHSVPPPKMIMPGTGYVYCLPISNDHWAA